MSYWVQAGLAILGFLGILLWAFVVPYSLLLGSFLRHGQHHTGRRPGKIRIIAQKHLSRLTVALTDFQKAQCFFMLATNVAAQVVVRKGTLDPQSLQQLYSTYVFMKLIAVSGYLPVTFTLFTLHLVGMLSWYLVVLSCLSITLSIATLATVGTFTPTQAESNSLREIASKGGPQECGGAQPGVYCFEALGVRSELNTSGIDHAAYSMLGYCLTVACYILVVKAELWRRSPIRSFLQSTSSRYTFCVGRISTGGSWIIRYPPTRQFLKRICQLICSYWNYASLQLASYCNSTRFPRAHLCARSCFEMFHRVERNRTYTAFLDTTVDTWCRIRQHAGTMDYSIIRKMLFLTVANIIISSLYLRFFTIFLGNLAWFARNDVYNKKWNFGQVVAIAVWATPICEYIHLELSKFFESACQRTLTNL